jgi:hypothetical protein
MNITNNTINQTISNPSFRTSDRSRRAGQFEKHIQKLFSTEAVSNVKIEIFDRLYDAVTICQETTGFHAETRRRGERSIISKTRWPASRGRGRSLEKGSNHG